MVNYKIHLPKKKWPKIIFLVMTILIVALLTSVFMVRRSYLNNLKPVSMSQKAQLVTIPLGSSVSQIADRLHKAGVIRSIWAFEWYVRNSDARDKLKAGSYSVTPSQTVQEIVAILTKGKIATSLFTILPAKRVDQIKQSMINAGFPPADVEHAFDPSVYAGHPALVDKPAGASLEGYLYPDSYQKTADSKAETIIRASLDEMQSRLTPELRAAIVRQGLTIHQGVILASIIEKEENKADYKPIVAQVFLKRLREGMVLGSDVTAHYGAIAAGQELSQGESLGYDSPYNTHIYANLPPGPISNVSESSLRAVANPANTDYLYFVAGDDDENHDHITYFSRTLQEHESSAQLYCKKKCGR